MTNTLTTNTTQMKTIAEMIRPDDTFYWTQAEMEKEMPGFSFQGVGWYTRPEAVMLIVPDGKSDGYQLWVFYNRDPRVAFEALTILPERLSGPKTQQALKSIQRTTLILNLGFLALLIASVYVGMSFGLVAEIPVIVLMVVWSTYIRRLLLKKKS
jgi:hypothetical protein